MWGGTTGRHATIPTTDSSTRTVLKHGIFLFVLLHVLPFPARADVGSCVRYKLRLTFTGGEKISGHYLIWNYDFKIDRSENEILQFLQADPNATLYKRIQTIEYPRLNPAHTNAFKYSAAADSDRVEVDAKKIVKIEVLGHTPCEHTSITDKEYLYLVGIYPLVVEGLKQSEIDLLQNKPFQAASCDRFKEEHYPVSVEILSYNPSIPEKAIKERCDSVLGRLMATKSEKELNEQITAEKRKFRKEKVIVLTFLIID